MNQPNLTNMWNTRFVCVVICCSHFVDVYTLPTVVGDILNILVRSRCYYVWCHYYNVCCLVTFCYTAFHTTLLLLPTLEFITFTTIVVVR